MKKERMEKRKKRIIKKASYSFLYLLSILIIFFGISLAAVAVQTPDAAEISQLEQNLAGSSYSDFQKRMILTTAQEAIEEGIAVNDAVSILEESIENRIDPYNIKKFFDTLIAAKEEGISEESLLNKVMEGLAKDVEERLIIDALTQKSENMKIARSLLEETRIKNGDPEEMVDILADSLTNGVPLNALSEILSLSTEQGKSWQEVEEVAEELGNLGLKASELGIDGEKIEILFNQAIENQDSLENICMNIQDLMIAAVAVQMTSILSQQDRSSNENSGDSSTITDIPISSSGSSSIGSGTSMPTGETGSSPVSSDDSSASKPDSESGSSPLD